MADHDAHDHTGVPGVGVGDATAHIADATDAHDASAISVLDSGANFTGTDVEAVLAELQDNIDAIGAGGVPGWVAALAGTTDATNFYWDGNDLAGFTEVDITGTTVWTEAQNLVSVVVAGMTAEDANCVLIAKTFATGDTWQVPVLGVLGHTAGTVAIRAGIIFTDGTVAASNCVGGHFQCATSGAAPSALLVGRHGTLTNMNTAPWVSDDEMASPQLFLGYVRLKYQAANTFRLWFSPDGVSWTTLGESDISKTMTPTHVGLFVHATESDETIVTFGPLRKVA